LRTHSEEIHFFIIITTKSSTQSQFPFAICLLIYNRLSTRQITRNSVPFSLNYHLFTPQIQMLTFLHANLINVHYHHFIFFAKKFTLSLLHFVLILYFYL
jgi:hypothetical protein